MPLPLKEGGPGRMTDPNSQQTVLEIGYSRLGDYVVIELEGEVDVYTAGKLRDAIREKVEEGEYRLAVDLSKVAFLDSTGLGVLVGGLKRLNPHDGKLAIICDNERILRIFRITGLEKIFTIFPGAQALTETRAGD